MNKINKSIVISLFLICILFFSGCFDSDNNSKKEKVSYEYYIEISNDSINETTIYLPIPITYNGKISKINNNLKIIHGKGDFKIQNSSYGSILNITFFEEIIIHYSGNDLNSFLIDGDYPKLILSTVIDTDNDGEKYDENDNVKFWIFMNNSDNYQNTKFKLFFNFTYSGIYNNNRYDTQEQWKLIKNLDKNGWQIVEGYRLWKEE